MRFVREKKSELETGAQHALVACRLLLDGKRINGEQPHIDRLVASLRERVVAAPKGATIGQTTYFDGVLEMLAAYGNFPTQKTIGDDLTNFAQGLAHLDRLSKDEVRRYEEALITFTEHITPARKY